MNNWQELTIGLFVNTLDDSMWITLSEKQVKTLRDSIFCGEIIYHDDFGRYLARLAEL